MKLGGVSKYNDLLTVYMNSIHYRQSRIHTVYIGTE